jgi:hypothetical protein
MRNERGPKRGVAVASQGIVVASEIFQMTFLINNLLLTLWDTALDNRSAALLASVLVLVHRYIRPIL